MTESTPPAAVDFSTAPDFKTLLGELAGYASTCWVGGTGDRVFDSRNASAAVDSALGRMREIFASSGEQKARQTREIGVYYAIEWAKINPDNPAHEHVVLKFAEQIAKFIVNAEVPV